MYHNFFNRVTAVVSSAALVSILALPSPALARDDTLKKLLLLGAAAVVVKTIIDNQHQSSSAPVYVTPRLSRAQISDIQYNLRRGGFYTGRIDGIWGNQTKQALLYWQRANGYRATGVLTAAQLAVLDNVRGATLSSSGGYISSTPVPRQSYYAASNLTRSQLVGLQADLRFLGYYSGTVDGVWGQHSQASLERYRLDQRQQGDVNLHAQPGALDLASVAISARQLEDDISADLGKRLANSRY